jgi:hypothetical protein
MPLALKPIGYLIAGMLGTLGVLAPTPTFAQVATPSSRPGDAFDVMNYLAGRGLHGLTDERWNAYGQLTYIHQYKPAFSARYTNLGGSPHSLLPTAESSFTISATIYAGLALWRGAEAYVAPEIISLRAFSELRGLGGAVQNFELQKSGSEWPTLYPSRFYLRQTFNLGGNPVARDSNPLQLGNTTTTRRLTIMLGKFSVLDVMDKNSYASDLRRQFLNMAFLTHMAYDFAADARGYAMGGLIEYTHGNFAIRFARMTPPKHPNQLAIDYRIHRYYGDQLELEHQHTLYGLPGAIRILGYRNREAMGKFTDALAAYQTNPANNAAACVDFNYESPNPTAPDLCWVRRPNVKIGLGLNLEQQVAPDLGLFLRGMISDGKTEVYSYMSADRSLSFGALGTGARWRRAQDLVGVGYGLGFLSKPHADYLAAGGVDGFIGDGALNPASERVIEVFYSAHVFASTFLSADYQRITNPAFNADRGPVTVVGGRVHAEF